MYIYYIEDLLTGPELDRVLHTCRNMNFIDGRADSNPDSQVKHNLQADVKDPKNERIVKIIRGAMTRNRQFLEYTVAKKITPPMIARYEPGMDYGEHTDSAIMAVNQLTRVDISCTLFLSDPESYEGGELCIRAGQEMVRIKRELGVMVLYPTISLHQVTPVTKGQRLVAVTFVQSQIRDHYRRELLFELAEVLESEGDRLSEEMHKRFTNVQTNLHRLWAEI